MSTNNFYRKTLRLRAPAKINLWLSILKKLQNGYHEVESIFSQVSLFDEICLREIEGDEISVICDNPRVPKDELNTVYKAAKLLKEETGVKRGIEIKIKKKIPVAAGLAGGSSDAAQTLIGLNQLWNLGLDRNKLMEIGVKIGFDVRYQLLGGTRLEIQGYKEKDNFRTLPKLPTISVVVCNPGVEVESAWAYRLVDYSKVGKKQLKELLRAIKKKDLRMVAQNLHNDFEYWIPRFHPVIRKIKNKMLGSGALGAIMSGSGPTVFALCPNSACGRKIYQELKKDYPQTYLVETL